VRFPRYGVEDGICPVDLTWPHLASQLADAGRTFMGFSEGLPRPGTDPGATSPAAPPSR
jgi:hypothetical protein